MALVWYSAWQMECCGEPFSVNDSVEWQLTTSPDVDWLGAVIGDDLAAHVTHQEEHHELDEGAVAMKGRVRSIRCAYSRCAPAPSVDTRTLYPVPGTAEFTSAERVDGTEEVRRDVHLNGYLVDIDLDPSSRRSH